MAIGRPEAGRRAGRAQSSPRSEAQDRKGEFLVPRGGRQAGEESRARGCVQPTGFRSDPPFREAARWRAQTGRAPQTAGASLTLAALIRRSRPAPSLEPPTKAQQSEREKVRALEPLCGGPGLSGDAATIFRRTGPTANSRRPMEPAPAAASVAIMGATA